MANEILWESMPGYAFAFFRWRMYWHQFAHLTGWFHPYNRNAWIRRNGYPGGDAA